ncbi:MAG: hypothetical protein ACI8WT_000197 [Clostridium sp.]|jgi:hypothetical protein
MKEWCLQHPWMTFFALIFTIYLFFNKKFISLRGKKEFMENLSNKGGITMSDKNENGSRKGNDTQSPSERKSIYENGCQSVPPTKSSPPEPPSKQK